MSEAGLIERLEAAAFRALLERCLRELESDPHAAGHYAGLIADIRAELEEGEGT